MNKLTLILLSSLVTTSLADTCYYGNERNLSQKSLKELNDVSKWLKTQETDDMWYNYQYNGYSVSKEEYERLMRQDNTQKIELRKP